MGKREVIKYDKNKNINEYNIGDGLEDKYFESLGRITFAYSKNGIIYMKKDISDYTPKYLKEEKEIEDYESFTKEKYFQKWIADMMTGEEFLLAVDSGCFIDYDGSLSDIYVDGYLSNLGLRHKGICQGNFLVDADTFKDICNKHHILVDWANK